MRRGGKPKMSSFDVWISDESEDISDKGRRINLQAAMRHFISFALLYFPIDSISPFHRFCFSSNLLCLHGILRLKSTSTLTLTLLLLFGTEMSTLRRKKKVEINLKKNFFISFIHSRFDIKLILDRNKTKMSFFLLSLLLHFHSSVSRFLWWQRIETRNTHIWIGCETTLLSPIK